ncbi:MAG TPA: hypothetical protein VNF68_10135 [Candidatus Baltobacteraceae bacterium]|nr:hypothetical protein [Candidatus Baltobacteraceae bacterium]
MLYVRMLLSIAIAVVGAILIVRMFGQGLRFEILPGLVLGLAMVALGAHRLSLILRARNAA